MTIITDQFEQLETNLRKLENSLSQEAASNCTPQHRIEELSQSFLPLVRYFVAGNPKTSMKILYRLSCDENDIVREKALKRI